MSKSEKFAVGRGERGDAGRCDAGGYCGEHAVSASSAGCRRKGRCPGEELGKDMTYHSSGRREVIDLFISTVSTVKCQ